MPDSADAVPEEQVRDGRRAPFCFQTHAALALIRENFTGAKRTTALAVYLSLTEAANRSGGAAARDGFLASRPDIAEAVGISVDTLDRYAADLVKAGLLEVERRRFEGVNLPNRWVLVDPPPVPPVAAWVRPGGGRVGAAQVLKKEPLAKKGETTSPSAAGAPVPEVDVPPPLVKVAGRNLGWDALAEVCGIDPASPRAGQIAVALNGARGGVGIRHLCWREVFRWSEEHEGGVEELAKLADSPERFEVSLARNIRRKAELYLKQLSGATLTPTALRDWWLDLEKMPRPGGGMSPEEIARFDR